MATAVLGLALLTTACTGEEAPAPQPPPLSPPAPAAHPAAPRPPDRDEKAVLTTLDGINPCALVEPAQGADIVQLGPHQCTVHPEPESTHDTTIHVRFEQRMPRSYRYHLPTKLIGGTKVDAIEQRADRCALEIPVSFQFAVQIEVTGVGEIKPCDIADSTAATAIARLAAPNKVRHRADRPDLSKDACTVLTAGFKAIGITMPAQTDSPPDTIDFCHVPTYSPDAPHADVNFSLSIERSPQDDGSDPRWTTIAGKTIYRDDCSFKWSEGPVDGENDRVIRLLLGACQTMMSAAQLNTLLTTMIIQLGKAQAPAAVTELTYHKDEPDEPNPGACVDYLGDACEPYQPTPAPAGALAVSQAAAADPHVACTATADGVHAQFPQLRPVVDTQQMVCNFVAPSHAVQLTVHVQRGDRADGDETNRRNLTIAGHPALYRDFSVSLPHETSIASLCVHTGTPGDRADWQWCLTAVFQSPRDKPVATPDTSGSVKLEPAMTDLATHYLR